MHFAIRGSGFSCIPNEALCLRCGGLKVKKKLIFNVEVNISEAINELIIL